MSTTTTGIRALDDLLRNAATARWGGADIRVSASTGNVNAAPGRDAPGQRFIDQAYAYAAGNRQQGENAFFSGFQPRGGGLNADIRVRIGLDSPAPWCPPPRPMPLPRPIPQPLPPTPPAPSNPSNASTSIVDGRVQFENDNYVIAAGDDTTVTVTNKKTGATYQASGDPHMYINGEHAFDFWGTTSLALDDGTKVTIGTVDAGGGTTQSSKVTITNGDYGVQIKGVDNRAQGDLAYREFEGTGDALDAQVDDGVVLEENAAGNDLVTTDRNGVEFDVNQDYILGVDQLKTQGLASENVDAFDDPTAAFDDLVFGNPGDDIDWSWAPPGGAGRGGFGLDLGVGIGGLGSMGGMNAWQQGGDASLELSMRWLQNLQQLLDRSAGRDQQAPSSSSWQPRDPYAGLQRMNDLPPRLDLALKVAGAASTNLNLRLWG